MTHAIVLIEGERGEMDGLGSRLAEIEGVGQVYSVTGEWDFVALVHLAKHEALTEVVREGIGSTAGVARTHTHVAFKTYSRHDLESIFASGEA